MNRLFRHFAKLMLSGLILTVGSCAYDESVREMRNQPQDNESLVIAFSNGIIDSPIPMHTRALALLSEHMESMGVWGWQTTQEGVTERLFLNQEVTFSTSLAKWTYSPLKYWDSKSTYKFYAYAPHSGSAAGVTASINPDNHAISIKGVTLQGSNTIDSGVPAPPANFGKVADQDWMLDRTGQSMAGVNRSEVIFNMEHILSKLSIRVRRSYLLPDSIVSIKLDSIKIGSFISQGDFVQTMEDASQVLAPEWTPVDTMPRYTITSAKHVSIPDSAVYVLESLLIPQPVIAGQYIRVWYNIGNKGGYINHMDNIFSLDELFSGFETGKNYVITVTIGPDPIKFDAGVQDWTNNSSEQSAFSKNEQ